MSRKNQRRKQPVVERAAQGGRQGNIYYGPQGIQGAYGAYSQGKTVTIPASIVAQMLASMAPQKNQASDFAPGSPLQPYQGVVPLGGPRQFSYSPGINLTPPDRTLAGRFPDATPFQQLRMLAGTYDGITLCERVILDMIPALAPKVRLKTWAADQGIDENDHTDDIKQWMAFVENPSPGQNLDIHSWLKMAWTESTQIDALSIFRHKNKGGGLFGLEIIAGDEVKPLLDERGMVPQPPYPAYQNYPYGVPGDEYTVEQMLYWRESPRAFTPYGFSRVERIITRVNQALRKEQKDLSYFTEGNQPFAFMEVPESSTWSPDQIDAYEQAWNALLAGNLQQQVRMKFLQPGMKYIPAEIYQLLTDFDKFILNVAVAAYGLSMGDVGFTEDIHKSSGDSQQNMMYRRTLAPFVSVYCGILTRQCFKAFGNAYLEVVMDGYTEAEDLQTQADAYGKFATVGAISPASIARLMKFPEIPETGPLIQNPKIGIVPLSNYEEGSQFRKASDAAQLAGLQMAANPQPAQQQGGNAQADNSDTGDGEEDEAADEADKSLATLTRSDPVRGPGGKFGYDGGPHKAPGQHHGGHYGHHHHSTGSHMEHIAERLARLANRKVGKHWTAQQHKAAIALENLFSELARGKSGEQIAALLSQARSEAATLFAGKPKGLASMTKALDRLGAPAQRSATSEALDELEDHYDALGEALDALLWEEEEEMMPATRADVRALLETVETLLRQDRAKQTVRGQSEGSQGTQHNTGMMLAFMLDGATARKLALPDGESPSDMHITLAYMGSMDDTPTDGLLRPHTSPERLITALNNFTQTMHTSPFAGNTQGIARFAASEHSDGLSPIVALVNLPGLQEWRRLLVREALAGYFVAENFDFLPHITLAYVPEDAPMPVEVPPNVPLQFDTICLVIGDEQYVFKFGEGCIHEPITSQNTERTRRTDPDTGRRDSEVAAGQATTRATQSLSQRADLQTTVDSKLVASEYKRWYFRAKDDVRAGRAQRGFTTTIIPEPVHDWIADELSRATSVEDVKRIFDESRERETSFFALATQ